MQKRIDCGHRRDGKRGPQALRSRPGEIHEPRKKNDGDASDRHALTENLAPRPFLESRIDQVELEQYSHHNGESDDQALAVIESIGNHDSQSKNENERHDYGEVSPHDRSRYCDNHGDDFGQESQDSENSPDADADTAGGHPGDLHNGDAIAVSGVRYRPAQSGQEVADPIGIDCALDRAEVGRSRLAP